MTRLMVIVRASPPPSRTKVHPRHVKLAIQHAKNLCFNYENTSECRSAWEYVEELSEELERQTEILQYGKQLKKSQ